MGDSMENNKNVVGYVRVSSDEQVEGYSLDNQREDIKKYCDLHDLNLIGIFSDEGISGKNIEKRKDFKDMINFIEAGKANCIVIWKASRISRNFLDFAEMLKKFEEIKCRLISVKDNYDTADPSSKLSMYMHGIIADLERDNLRVQVRGGMRKRAREGRFNGGNPPFGYNYNRKIKELLLNEDEKGIVKEIFDLYLKGWGYSKIAKHLNSFGYKTKKGNNFSLNAVKGILKNPIYAGKIRWERYKDWDKNKRKGLNKEYIYVDGIHQAIISEEKFELVQEKIKNNPKSGNTGKPSNYLLSGILRCPACGYGMAVQKITKKNSINYYYTCGAYQNKKGCSPNSNKMEKIDNQFIELMSNYVNNLSLEQIKKSLAKDKSIEKSEIEKKINDVKNELKNLKMEQNNLLKAYSMENAPLEILNQKLNQNQAKTEELQTTLNELDIERSKQGEDVNPKKIYSILENFKFIMEIADRKEKRELVKTLVHEVHINSEGTITKIILKLNQKLKIQYDKKDKKKFIITCGTVHPYLF
ncbi:recombinase family protein [Dethiothermospora halolimnae]|uniref:recombinase family protein n=1 Tax=Dethiothermospora halolimnae TaxID=3114390 RepID=UPI003CCBF4EB